LRLIITQLCAEILSFHEDETVDYSQQRYLLFFLFAVSNNCFLMIFKDYSCWWSGEGVSAKRWWFKSSYV